MTYIYYSLDVETESLRQATQTETTHTNIHWFPYKTFYCLDLWTLGQSLTFYDIVLLGYKGERGDTTGANDGPSPELS